MNHNESKRGTFVIRLTGAESATWQGTVTWADEDRTVPFRCMIELLRLIDGAMSEDMTSLALWEDHSV